MSAGDEAVVRRFYEEMNNDRKLELAADLFTSDHKFHDPQVPTPDGPVALDWRKIDGKLRYDVSAPSGYTVEVRQPQP